MSNPIRPVTRSKRQARDHYHRLSRWYDLLVGASEKKYRNLGLQRLEARPGERILEIGCGTGQAILSLAAAVGPTGLVCGLDLAAGMLAVSHARVGRAALADRVALLQGDAAGLPYAAGSFDAIFMSFTLELLDTPEIPLVLQRCRTVLRPDGRLVVVALARQPGTAVAIYEWLHDRLPVLVDCRPIYARAALREAGFQIGAISALSMWGLPVEIVLARAGGAGMDTCSAVRL
jgi:ubiquinone/menaquinone biosynthesis C-methylase UbiE